MGLRRFLLKPKPVAILLCLKDTHQIWYPSKLAKSSGASYVYVTHWLTRLEKAGWVKLEKKGRLKSVVASDAGLAAASALDELVRKIDALGASASAPAPSAMPAEGETTKKPARESEGREKERDRDKEKEKG